MIATPTAIPTRALLIAAAMLLVACTGHESGARGESAAATARLDSQPGAARGHLQLTGDATLDTEFVVSQCSIGPAGNGLLSGYHMSARASRGTLQMLSVALRDYQHDGAFTPVVDSVKSSPAVTGVVSGPISLTIGRENSTVPITVIPKPESKLTITISDSGATGKAEFSELTSPMAMEDVDIKAPLHAKRKTFAGSLSWRCPAVEHIDSATAQAARGMLKGLTPIR